MTADDIAKGRALAEAATDGPWEAELEASYLVEYPDDTVSVCINAPSRREGHVTEVLLVHRAEHGPGMYADAAYIVHACNTLPAALDHIGTVEGERDRLRASLTDTQSAALDHVDATDDAFHKVLRVNDSLRTVGHGYQPFDEGVAAAVAELGALRTWSFCPFCGVKAPRPATHQFDESGDCPGAEMQRGWALR